MTKLQRLEAAAVKWAKADAFLDRVGEADRARLDLSPWASTNPSADWMQAHNDECDSRAAMYAAARELLR